MTKTKKSSAKAKRKAATALSKYDMGVCILVYVFTTLSVVFAIMAYWRYV